MNKLIPITMAGLMTACSASATTTDIECLATNIYHEARGEVTEGQVAVAYVVMNRVAHDYFPNTVCDVIYQRSQFSWTHDNISDTPRDQNAYRLAEAIARAVINQELEDPTNGSLFYHATWVNPTWARRMDESLELGVHVFYTWDGNWNND